MKKALYVLSIVFLISVMFGMAGCGLFGGKIDTGGSGGGSEKTITISIAEEGKVGEKVLLEKQANFSPFYQKNILYEFIGENTCLAEFSHELEDNWWNTYIIAKKSGEATIQLSYIQDDSVVAKSNSVTIRITANTIGTVEELKAIAGTDQAYELSADIDLSSEENWTPIEGFTGTLNGGGHSILNLSINSVNSQNLGLFGTLQGSVSDLIIDGAEISARGNAENAGIVAGSNEGTISGVTVNGIVDLTYYNSVGGIVGYNSGKIFDCINEASVKGAGKVGGICGTFSTLENDTLSRNVNKGEISGEESVGGIAGYLCMPEKYTNYTFSLSNNQNEASVFGTNNIGGVFGYVYGMYYDGSHQGKYILSVLDNTGSVEADGSYAGGIVGRADRLISLSVCSNNSDVTGKDYVGSWIGYGLNTEIDASGEVNYNTVSGKSYIGGFAGFAGVVKNANNSGNVLSSGSIIENGQSMAYVGGVVGYCTGITDCRNDTDITVSGGGEYVGGVAGYINAGANDLVNGNTNKGIVESNGNNVGGIAGYLCMPRAYKNPVYTLSVNNNQANVTGEDNVGGIFGHVFGMYYDGSHYGLFDVSVLKNSGEIRGGNKVGGIVGNGERVQQMVACENTGNVYGENYVGGWAGYAPYGQILATDVINYSTIEGKAYLGGFAGYAQKVDSATNAGDIVSVAALIEEGQSFAYVGGIVGYCTAALNCVNLENITVNTDGSYVGGIAGYVLIGGNGNLNGNENLGDIESSGDCVGGISGYITMPRAYKKITYSLAENVNEGMISGRESVGGIIGRAVGMYYDGSHYGTFEISYCNNAAQVSGQNYVGGIVGSYERLNTDSNIMDTNITDYGNKLGH